MDMVVCVARSGALVAGLRSQVIEGHVDRQGEVPLDLVPEALRPSHHLLDVVSLLLSCDESVLGDGPPIKGRRKKYISESFLLKL